MRIRKREKIKDRIAMPTRNRIWSIVNISNRNKYAISILYTLDSKQLFGGCTYTGEILAYEN